MASVPLTNPTDDIDLDFAQYVADRRQHQSAHLVNGVPTYAFAMDLKLRQQLAALKPMRVLAQAVVSFRVPWEKQTRQMNAIAVGPRQYPEIYAMAEDCARRLGIGVPEVFIYYSPHLDAYTFAAEEKAPVIVLSSALVDAYEPDELKFVIGHECGHVHNLHSVYNTVVVLMSSPLLLASGIVPAWMIALVRQGLLFMLMRWSRHAEVTADRAGLICVGDQTVAEMALAKLAMGGSGAAMSKINVDLYLEQLKHVRSSPARFLEFLGTHPLVHKRIEAVRLFGNCDVLHSWRPELRALTSPVSKNEVDSQCERIISVV